MITDINLIFARGDAYTALVGGNGGENELVISCSPGQDGNVAVSLVAMSVDGGAKRLGVPLAHDSRDGIALVRLARLESSLRMALTRWRSGGVPGSVEEVQQAIAQCEEVLAAIVGTWGVHDATGASTTSPEYLDQFPDPSDVQQERDERDSKE